MHSGVSKKPNVDEECEKLLEDRSCRYFNNLPKVLNGLATYVPQVVLQCLLHILIAIACGNLLLWVQI